MKQLSLHVCLFYPVNRPDENIGSNSDKTGQYVYRLANMDTSVKNPRCECWSWYVSTEDEGVDFPSIPCPGTLAQAEQDPNFIEGCHSSGSFEDDTLDFETEFGSWSTGGLLYY